MNFNAQVAMQRGAPGMLGDTLPPCDTTTCSPPSNVIPIIVSLGLGGFFGWVVGSANASHTARERAARASRERFGIFG